MKKFITFFSLGIGALVLYKMKRKRRRLLEPQYNKVAVDFEGTVPNQLFKYLRNLGEATRTKGDYELWGYHKSLEFSKKVLERLEKDVVVVLGLNKMLTSKEGKPTYLFYSKTGYPNSLIHVVQDENGYLIYHSSVDFDVL